jgi:hypothetical protein
MNPATEPAGRDDDAARDPYFNAADPGPGKSDSRAGDPERLRRRFRRRIVLLAAALGAAWIGVLHGPQVGPLVLWVLGSLGITLAVMAAAMGLGLLGFGLFAAGGRVAGWLRRAARWPDE